MNQREREAWRIVLDGALRDRAELDATISHARRVLGLQDEDNGGEASEPAAGPLDVGTDPVASTREGEFFGMSGPQATEALMRKFGRSRPLKTDEIFNAIRKGGVQIQSKEGLYRTLTRDADFHRVGRGTWGLSEWYPGRSRRRRGDEAEDSSALNGPDTGNSDDAGNGGSEEA